MQSKVILDLCGGVSNWSKPYKEAGYTVINVTLPEYDVSTYQPPANVYGILAAPPCTLFSLARSRVLKERDFEEGIKLVKAYLNIIWKCRENSKCGKDGYLRFWALEYPTGFLRRFLGYPYFTFDPYEFGERYTKKTDLWGYFNIPKKFVIISTDEEKTGSDQSVLRMMIPKGFAEAFFKANP